MAYSVIGWTLGHALAPHTGGGAGLIGTGKGRRDRHGKGREVYSVLSVLSEPVEVLTEHRTSMKFSNEA